MLINSKPVIPENGPHEVVYFVINFINSEIPATFKHLRFCQTVCCCGQNRKNSSVKFP